MDTPPKDSQEPAASAAPSSSGSLDETAGSLDSTDASNIAAEAAANAEEAAAKKKRQNPGYKSKFAKMNFYLTAFVFVVIIATMVVVIGIDRGRKSNEPETINTQDLSADSLNSLNNSDIKIGDAKQTLSVESNAVFAGRVLVQGGVDIAGALKVGGELSLTDLVVTGKATFTQAQASDLAVSGNAGIQGQLTVQKSINVTGGATFGGEVSIPKLTVDNLALTDNLQFGKHIDAGGGTPSRTNGSALGGGGTSSLSGTDTAGTVTIATGSSPAAGCFMSATFSTAFSSTPHIAIAPVNLDTADLNYYVTRTATGFSICATNPAAVKNYTFDYIVVD